VGRYLVVGLLWLGLGVLGTGLLVMMHTRWGQLHPLRKCFVLSLLAHLLLIGYSATMYVAPSRTRLEDRVIRVSLADDPPAERQAGPANPGRQGAASAPAPPPSPPPAAAAAPPRPKSPSPAPELEKTPAKKLTEPIRVPARPDRPGDPKPPPGEAVRKPQGPFEPALQPIRKEDPPSRPGPKAAAAPGRGAAQPGAGGPSGRNGHRVPSMYRLRFASDRSQQAQRRGSSPKAEAAVAAALRWLARNQEPDGRWSAVRHDGGRESFENERDRQGAGTHADAAVTALAILAVAASGNTHRQGEHPDVVRGGMVWLLTLQGDDGNLAGPAAVYEFMYCHGMASLALAELLGMTGDEYLREPVRRAVAYTLAAQDPVGGGWRYRAREPGDTSQLGWQLMALKSAELAGVDVPEAAWQGARRFLEGVSAGTAGGLASYRPGERVTRPMTAEALACRHFLGLSPESTTSTEAGDYLLGELPGGGTPNLYYWYYGTIAMYQLQGDYWAQWVRALQRVLVDTQRQTGPLAGSWDPNTQWDSYGGRVYATALATLCLEAFYRFTPPDEVAESAGWRGQR